MLFLYKAQLDSGEIVEGEITGEDRFDVSKILRTKGQMPIMIEPVSNKNFNLDHLFSFFSKIGLAELILFNKNLSGMIKAGLSLSRGLSVLEKQAKKEKWKKVLNQLSAGVALGETFSSLLEKHPKVFSKLFVSMVKAGEESGNLANALVEVGMNLEKSYTLKKKIKGAMIYPAVIFSAMIIVGMLLFAFVVPTLAKTFKELNTELPGSTKFIINVGNFLSENLLLSFLILFSFVGFLVYIFKAKFTQKYIDFIILRIPVIGNMVKSINTARTTRTIASLLISGVSIVRAIDITKDVVQNIYYKKVLEDAKIAIEKGAPFYKVFEDNERLYPVMMSQMVQVGEETGKLSDMLLQVATFYEEEVNEKTKNLSTIIEPVLMVVIGAGVGFFAVSMVTPLYSVMDNIK